MIELVQRNPAPKPASVIRPDFAFLDIEASGLHDTSYPIEIGWSDDGLNSSSFLIRPQDDWGVRDWSHESEQVHGIPRERLFDEGIPVLEAAERLNAEMMGKRVFSDHPRMELFWLRRLYVAAGWRVAFTVVEETHAIVLHLQPKAHESQYLMQRFAQSQDLAERIYPHIHRAAEDSVGLAAVFRMTVDPEFFGSVVNHDLERGHAARSVNLRQVP